MPQKLLMIFLRPIMAVIALNLVSAPVLADEQTEPEMQDEMTDRISVTAERGRERMAM